MVVMHGLVQNRQVGCLVSWMHQQWSMVAGMHTVSMEQMSIGENSWSMMVGMDHRSSKNPA